MACRRIDECRGKSDKVERRGGGGGGKSNQVFIKPS